MLLLRDCADPAKPWICSFTTLPWQARLAGCIPGGTLLPGSVLLKSVCLDQAEDLSFHDMVLVVHQGWSLSTAVPKP